MKNIGKGSKYEYAMSFDGLSGAVLDGFRVDFYAIGKTGGEPTGYYTVESGQDFDPDADSYSVVCDTSELDLGQLYATVTIRYTTANDISLTEISTVQLEEKIVAVRMKPVEEEPVEEPVEEPNEEPVES